MTEDNVIDFITKVKGKAGNSTEEDKQHEESLLDLAAAIDLAVDLSMKERGLKFSEALAILCHRLGSYMNNFEHKEKAYLLLDDIVRTQANLVLKDK